MRSNGRAVKAQLPASSAGTGLHIKSGVSCSGHTTAGALMDTLPSLHAVPASWLHDSVLAPYIAGYWKYLARRGYADHTARVYVYCVAHFARWLRRRRVAACDLTDDSVRKFITEHLPRLAC